MSHFWTISKTRSANLWVSTQNGLSFFNTENKTFKNYDLGSFNHGAFFLTREKEVFLGGKDGIVRFFPNQLKDNPYIPPIKLTSFKKFNKEVALEKSLLEIENIKLNYKESVFSFEFSALDFSDPLKNLSKTQGLILTKMIERELDTSMHDLIKGLRGGFEATKWSFFGTFYGYHLKRKYEEGENPLMDAVLQDFELTHSFD